MFTNNLYEVSSGNREVIELKCLMYKKEQDASFVDIQLHVMIYLIHEREFTRVVTIWGMFCV